MTEICVLAPWPIFTVTIERTAEGKDEIYFHAGGQGFWVARMIANLGSKPILCGPIGGESGTVVRALIEAEGIALQAIDSDEWNGGYVHDRREGNRQTVADMECAELNRHESDDLYDAVLTAGMHAGVVVLTGAIKEDILAPEFYRRLAHDLHANGVKVIADLSRGALLAVDGGITFLKVSHEELLRAGFCENTERANVVAGLLKISETSKSENVIVSCAEEPAIALLGDRLLEVTPPRFEALDHHGAGDSMTAALAVAEARRMKPDAALRMAAAAGALNVTRHGLGTGKLAHIQEIASHVTVRPLDRNSL
ncbi:PfkB family carbohydrate kinase [Methyloligella sp. 2.7D]|uniref:PfkB family carbohydrate kinase n=1 Tax=unclassified Methyloligella TaxID=2625955 RepID=UPI00157D8630|nr:PfkB family carbohydrate kinase [Methyloligella sp. GL2]QKP76122.1 phosphofructokinase [Methyloligella sp. GL2]